VSHDTDKLIRQLSLVAFLMAERRPLTARDVKGNVEGYSEMSDEAFARRFYSDRAELIALGVPLHSQRDEFTGEELYTLRSENYFLDELELDDDELAALQTALYMLEGTFAYAEPLRLALQNLALGRPGFDDAPTETAASVQVRDPDYSPEMAGRLSKLESAISKQRTIKFSYWSPRRDQTRPGREPTGGGGRAPQVRERITDATLRRWSTGCSSRASGSTASPASPRARRARRRGRASALSLKAPVEMPSERLRRRTPPGAGGQGVPPSSAPRRWSALPPSWPTGATTSRAR